MTMQEGEPYRSLQGQVSRWRICPDITGTSKTSTIFMSAVSVSDRNGKHRNRHKCRLKNKTRNQNKSNIKSDREMEKKTMMGDKDLSDRKSTRLNSSHAN